MDVCFSHHMKCTCMHLYQVPCVSAQVIRCSKHTHTANRLLEYAIFADSSSAVYPISSLIVIWDERFLKQK